MYGRFSIRAEWYSLSSFLKSAEPGVAFPRSSSAFEARGEHGQPNQARSQSVEMLEWPQGSTSATPLDVVWKMCQPAGFLLGGSLVGRREVRVPQSMTWRSTFTPSFRSWAAVVSESALMNAMSLGAITTIFSPL